MIIAIDDEDACLLLIQQALELEGLSVATFTDPEEALARAVEEEPELIISDVMMPKLDGFALRKALAERLPRRDTPFVFLSSLAEPDHIVRGLEADADDYFTKPIDPRVLRAKVRSLLARRRRPEPPAFQGDLGRYPFIKVVQFCELQGLTGEVDFVSGAFKATVRFRAGDILLEDLDDADDLLTELYDLDAGTFTIRTRAIAFDELSEVAVAADNTAAPEPRPRSDRPMGKLSGVRVNDRMFQVQTEMVSRPDETILTVVILDGITLLKRHSSPPPSAGRDDLERLIGEQHAAVEKDLRNRVEELVTTRAADASTVKERYYRLFESGFESYRQGEIRKALASWEEARSLNPEDSTLQVNIKVARAKLEASD